jgi:hypothetical protein
MTSSIKSKMPFAAAAAAPSQDDADEEQNEDTDAAVDPERLSVHVAKEGVISGKMYRRSVLVSTMPKSPDAPPQKEGFLKKLSPAMFVGWQERFFVTNANGDIEYYKSVSSLWLPMFCLCFAYGLPMLCLSGHSLHI